MIDFSHQNQLNFARQSLNQLNLEGTTISIGEYSQSDIRDYIENYSNAESQEALLEISDILWVRSPHFRRLVQYFADMATFSYGIIPKDDIQVLETNTDSVREQYVELAKFAKNMNMKHEFRKVMLEAFKSDIFYGYVHYTEDDFYIQKMPREICAISSVEDGVFNYSVHMPSVEENIDVYKYTMPQEVIDLYNEWVGEQERSNSRNDRGRRGQQEGRVQREEEMVAGDWKELGAENTICIKFDEGNYDIIIPPFASSFESVYEIDGYKASRRNRDQIDNYMMIYQRIPIRGDSESNNDFTIDYDSVEFFHEEIADSVPESVGVVTTPMELEPIEFQRDTVDIDNVAKAEKGFWSASGTSQSLFSTENNTTQGINSSIATDEQIVFALLRQFQRWTNRFVKYAHGETMFSIEILDVTYFNQEKYYKHLLELSQYGIPVKTLIPASVGIEPIEVVGLSHLENEVFGIHESWIPLQSSHTMSNKDREASSPSNGGEEPTSPTEDTGGRPREDIDNLSDESLRKT